MTALNKTTKRLLSIVQGQYLMTHVSEPLLRDGEPVQQIQLEDCTGELIVNVWEKSAFIEAASPLIPVPVGATFYVRRCDIGLVGDQRAIHCAMDDVVSNGARLLPRSACPEQAHAALSALDHFNKNLALPSVRAFLNSVLLDLRVFNDLLTSPASVQSYRAYPGGLLVHAVAVMQLCATLATDRLPPLEMEIAQVACLIDQIDRKRTIRARQAQPGYEDHFDRAARPNQMLEYHESALRKNAPDIAKDLVGILDYLVQPNSRRNQAPSIAAEIARDANRFAVTQIDGHHLSNRSRKVVPFPNYQAASRVNPFDP